MMRNLFFALSLFIASHAIAITYPTPNTSTDLFVDSVNGVDGGICSFLLPCATLSATNLNKLTTSGATRLWMRAGSYTFAASYQSLVHSGISGTPLELLAYPSETVNVAIPQGGSLWDGVSYWNFWGGNYSVTDEGWTMGFNVTNSHLGFYYINATQSYQNTDNVGIIHADTEQTDYLDIRLCTFTGSTNGTGPGGQNTSLLYIRKQLHYNIIGNLFLNSWNPIYGKHELFPAPTSGQVSRIIQNNIFKNGGRYVEPEGNYEVIDNNLFINTQLALGVNGGIGTTDVGDVNATVKRNTFWGGSFATVMGMFPDNPPAIQPTGITVRDNVIASTAQNVGYFQYVTSDPQLTSNYNVFPTGSAAIYVHTGGSSTGLSLTSWQGLSSYFAGTTRDPNSIAGTATFAGSSSSVTPSAWQLTGPTAALTGSSVGGVVGVDYTTLLTDNTPFSGTNISISGAPGSFSFSGSAGSIAVTANKSITGTTGAMITTGAIGQVIANGNITITGTSGSIHFSESSGFITTNSSQSNKQRRFGFRHGYGF